MSRHVLALLHGDAVAHRLRDLEGGLVDGGGRGGTDDGGVMRGGMEDPGLGVGLGLSPAQVVGSGADSGVGGAVVTVDRSALGHGDRDGGGDVGGDHLGVVAHHVPGVDGLGGGLLAGGGDDLLAVLGDGCVHYFVVLLVTHLPGALHLAYQI